MSNQSYKFGNSMASLIDIIIQMFIQYYEPLSYLVGIHFFIWKGLAGSDTVKIAFRLLS